MSLEKIMFGLYSAVMTAAASIFNFLIELAKEGVNILPNDFFGKITDNIYVLLSVVMLFYLAISLLTYLVSPNKLADSSRGGAKLIVNIIITLVLLIFTPTIFDMAQDLQTAILEENVIGRVILMQPEDADTKFSTAGDTMVYGITRAVLVPDSQDKENDELYRQPFFDKDTVNRIQHLSALGTYTHEKDDYNFNSIVGIALGVIMILVLFNFCFDIAIRIAKLAFLELIAPFPIISNLIPAKKQNKLTSWASECGSTYLSLFIRIAIIYLVIFIIENVGINVKTDNWLIIAMFYIGLLLFAKQAPQLISDIFGIKPSGSFSLNPLKRIREIPVLGSAVQTAGAAVGGLATGAALGYKATGGLKGMVSAFDKDGFKGVMKNLGRFGGMTGGGMLYGARAGFNQTKLFGVAAKDQKVDKTAYNAGSSAVRQAITGDDKAGSGLFDSINRRLGKPTQTQSKAVEEAQKDYEREFKQLDDLKKFGQELKSNLGVAKAQNSAYRNQLSAFDNQIAALENSRDQQIDVAVQPLEQNLQLKISSRDQDILNIHAMYDRKISDVQNSRTQRIDDMRTSIESELNRLENLASNTTDPATKQQYFDRITALKTQRANVEVEVDNQIRNEVNAYQQQKDGVETNIDNKISSLRSEIIHKREEITNNFAQQIDTVRSERETVARNYTVSHEKEVELQTQYDNVTNQIGVEADPTNGVAATGQYKAVADAKQNVKDQKDMLKRMQGKK